MSILCKGNMYIVQHVATIPTDLHIHDSFYECFKYLYTLYICFLQMTRVHSFCKGLSQVVYENMVINLYIKTYKLYSRFSYYQS